MKTEWQEDVVMYDDGEGMTYFVSHGNEMVTVASAAIARKVVALLESGTATKLAQAVAMATAQ